MRVGVDVGAGVRVENMQNTVHVNRQIDHHSLYCALHVIKVQFMYCTVRHCIFYTAL